MSVTDSKKQLKSIYLTYYKIRCAHIIAQGIYLSSFLKFVFWVSGSQDDKQVLISFGVLFAGLFFEFFFELATSRFADVKSKKMAIYFYSCCFSLFSLIISVCCQRMQSPKTTEYTIPLIIVAQLFYMIAQTFLSGSIEAWAVNNIKKINLEKNYTDMFTKSSILEGFCWIIGGLIGIRSEYAIYGWAMISVLMIFCMVVASIYIEDERNDNKYAISDFVPKINDRFLIDSFKLMFKSKSVFLLSIIHAISYTMWVIVWYLWPVLRDNIGREPDDGKYKLGNSVNAWIFYCIARILGSMIANMLSRYHLYQKMILFVSSILNSLPIIWIGYSCIAKNGKLNLLNLIIFLCVSKIGESLIMALRKPYLNKSIEDDGYRATLNSMSSFLGAFLAFVTVGLVWVYNYFGLHTFEKTASTDFIVTVFGRIFLVIGIMSLFSSFLYTLIPDKKT